MNCNNKTFFNHYNASFYPAPTNYPPYNWTEHQTCDTYYSNNLQFPNYAQECDNSHLMQTQFNNTRQEPYIYNQSTYNMPSPSIAPQTNIPSHHSHHLPHETSYNYVSEANTPTNNIAPSKSLNTVPTPGVLNERNFNYILDRNNVITPIKNITSPKVFSIVPIQRVLNKTSFNYVLNTNVTAPKNKIALPKLLKTVPIQNVKARVHTPLRTHANKINGQYNLQTTFKKTCSTSTSVSTLLSTSATSSTATTSKTKETRKRILAMLEDGTAVIYEASDKTK